MSRITRVVLATFNRDKTRELRALLTPLRIEVVGLYEVSGAKSPPESGKTVFENALIKARAAYDLTGLAAIADDTALEVDALDGEPGIHAARFAGVGASYRDNVVHLLQALDGVELSRRTARFRTGCVACLTDGREIQGEGVLEGLITDGPRGEEGFGYDPVFEVAGTGLTLAEMPAAEKNRISHRALALRSLLEHLDLS
jgi:XTP/dITP diphosphohydrolase